MTKIVVGVDPSGSRRGDLAGIIVAGKTAEGEFYVLQDLSLQGSPEAWASKAVSAYYAFEADHIVAETNFGGDMCESVIRNYDSTVPFVKCFASRGKQQRAEPVVLMFQRGKAHLVGNMPELEDELCSWTPDGNAASPGRLDAMCWALTDLGITQRPEPDFIRQNREWIEAMRKDASPLQNLGARIYAR